MILPSQNKRCRESRHHIKPLAFEFEVSRSKKAYPLNQLFVYNDANICSQERSAVPLSSLPRPSPDLRQPLFTWPLGQRTPPASKQPPLSDSFLHLLTDLIASPANASKDKLTRSLHLTACTAGYLHLIALYFVLETCELCGQFHRPRTN